MEVGRNLMLLDEHETPILPMFGPLDAGNSHSTDYFWDYLKMQYNGES